MEIGIGIGLAIVICALARALGFARDRSFYPVMMIVIASYYVLFAVMGGSRAALAAECGVATLFGAAAIAGYQRSAWIVAIALAGHGLFDLVHGRVLDNPGVPIWWPGFCGAFDLAAALWLAVTLWRERSCGAGEGPAVQARSARR